MAVVVFVVIIIIVAVVVVIVVVARQSLFVDVVAVVAGRGITLGWIGGW